MRFFVESFFSNINRLKIAVINWRIAIAFLPSSKRLSPPIKKIKAFNRKLNLKSLAFSFEFITPK
jgi:hypothetical protein